MKTNQSQKNIPNGWEYKKLSDVGKALIGLTYSPEDVVDSGGVLVLRSSNIKDGVIDYTDQVRVNAEKISQKNYVLDGDILICARNGSRNLIGKNAYISKSDEGNVFGAFMSVFRSKNPRYIYQLFQSSLYKREIEKDLGPTINQVTTGNLSGFKFSFPPTPEQNRIVSVLETWDKAIEKLSKKIEVKKQIKKGLMQDLLTGKKRVAGFTEKWKTVSLGDVLKERNERDVESDKLLLYSLTIEDGVCPKGERYDRSFLVKSDSKVYKKTYKNDIVYNPANLRYGAIAHNKNENPVLLSPIYQVLFVKDEKETNIDFIGQLLTWERQIRKMSAYAEGTLIERMEVKIDSFKIIQVDVPNKKEQDAIASVLNTANKEIALLEEKLSFIQEQKRYLLNNLITGTIRTPETLSTKLTK